MRWVLAALPFLAISSAHAVNVCADSEYTLQAKTQADCGRYDRENFVFRKKVCWEVSTVKTYDDVCPLPKYRVNSIEVCEPIDGPQPTRAKYPVVCRHGQISELKLSQLRANWQVQKCFSYEGGHCAEGKLDGYACALPQRTMTDFYYDKECTIEATVGGCWRKTPKGCQEGVIAWDRGIPSCQLGSTKDPVFYVDKTCETPRSAFVRNRRAY